MKKIFMILVIVICFFVNVNFVDAVSDTATSTVVMDIDSKRILYEKNKDEKRLIASITKIMTAVVAIENKKKPGPFVSIGETRQAEENNFSGALKPQGYSLDVKGKNLFIRGGSPGPLNGVISFLEEDLGCRWYAEPYRNIKHHPDPGLTVIPNLSGKKLPGLEVLGE